MCISRSPRIRQSLWDRLEQLLTIRPDGPMVYHRGDLGKLNGVFSTVRELIVVPTPLAVTRTMHTWWI